jgi:uncharacterized membrane protein
MTWLQRYRVRHYLRNSIWVWPAVTMAVAIIAVRTLQQIEEAIGSEANVNPETLFVPRSFSSCSLRALNSRRA